MELGCHARRRETQSTLRFESQEADLIPAESHLFSHLFNNMNSPQSASDPVSAHWDPEMNTAVPAFQEVTGLSERETSLGKKDEYLLINYRSEKNLNVI